MDSFRNKSAKFWAAALAHNQSHKSAVAIRPGTDEWSSWEAYFHHLGFKPSVMTLVEQNRTKTGEFTVPAQWPEWFDQAYAGLSRIAPPAAPKHLTLVPPVTA